MLSHWVKAHVEPPPYVFARFNVTCDVTAYTDDEYARALEGREDPQMANWTKEETDMLMKLCARFDLRWVVVADRYNMHPIAKGALRTVEDIKYRYYEVTRMLGEFRDKEKQKAASDGGATEAVKQEPGAEETKTEGSAVVKVEPGTTPATPAAPSNDKYFRFNITYEKQRKRQLELAFSRSIEEENEIRKLNEELRSVEQQLKKAAVKVDPKKKKELADVPYEIKRTMPTGAFLRSATLALPAAQPKQPALSSKMLKKMQMVLDEVGVPARPMPTKPVCEMFDRLRQDTVGLLSLRKHLAAKQAEMQLLRERYQTLTGVEYKPVTSKLQRNGEWGNAPVILSVPPLLTLLVSQFDAVTQQHQVLLQELALARPIPPLPPRKVSPCFVIFCDSGNLLLLTAEIYEQASRSSTRRKPRGRPASDKDRGRAGCRPSATRRSRTSLQAASSAA